MKPGSSVSGCGGLGAVTGVGQLVDLSMGLRACVHMPKPSLPSPGLCGVFWPLVREVSMLVGGAGSPSD